MKVFISGLSSEQLAAAQEICYMLGIDLDEQGTMISFYTNQPTIKVVYNGIRVDAFVGGQSQFARALGIALELIKKGEPKTIEETFQYEALTMMIDASRNAVIHKAAFEHLIRRLAVMGYTSVQMYTEDTFEMEKYPYFGYLRGRYSAQELQHMDAYAARFGIELIPCIQTLAHLGTTLRWKAHHHLVDYGDILLIDEPDTYEFIETMFKTMSENVKSRKINIGMDEAHMMGLGKYLDKHGYTDRASLMMKHFNKVMEIARKYGYQPMMWSDMFFRLASQGEYHNPDASISQEVVDQLPEDISLVYWDYYSVDSSKYDQMMRRHKQLTPNIIFAGCAWKWMGVTPANAFSIEVAQLAHSNCIKHNVREVIITAWGDNGSEASIYSILPSLQVWAELAYRNKFEEQDIEARFEACTGGSYHDFLLLDTLDFVPGNPKPGKMILNHCNPNKYLFYQDVLYGLFDAHVVNQATEYKAHFQEAVKNLEAAYARSGQWSNLFLVHLNYAKVLEVKATLGVEIRQAYLSKNIEQLDKLANVVIPEYLEALEQFMTAFHKQWLNENKVFGLDVMDIRIGGMKQRASTARQRLRMFIAGDLEQIEELEQKMLRYDGSSEDESAIAMVELWNWIATPSVIAGI